MLKNMDTHVPSNDELVPSGQRIDVLGFSYCLKGEIR